MEYCVQANSKQSTGCVRLDINFLKPSRIELQGQGQVLHCGSLSSSPAWLEYTYRTSHPVLRWLPTKLAEWIGENLQEALGFPDKADGRASPGTGWTPDELNHILQEHVVDGTLTTFGCVEWESEMFRGVMRARCYPFKLPKRRFHGFNPQVCIHSKSSTYGYILVHTGTYWYILVNSCFNSSILCRTL